MWFAFMPKNWVVVPPSAAGVESNAPRPSGRTSSGSDEQFRNMSLYAGMFCGRRTEFRDVQSWKMPSPYDAPSASARSSMTSVLRPVQLPKAFPPITFTVPGMRRLSMPAH